MEPYTRRHVILHICVMHAMKDPERPDGMEKAMLEVDRDIKYQNETGY